jgi:hypothetical protein
MKIRIQRTSIGTIFFLIACITAVLLIRPFYYRLSESLTEYEHHFSEIIREKTGLSVSYESLSPALLSSVKIKGISISDAVSGKQLLVIQQAAISYKSGMVITGVTVSGVTANFDFEKDRDVIERLRMIITGGKTQKNMSQSGKNQDFLSAFDSGAQIRLPFDIKMKNVVLKCGGYGSEVSVSLRSALFREDMKSECIVTNASGTISVEHKTIMIGKNRAVIGANFSFSGSILPRLTGSAVTFRISSLAGADYTFGKMDMLLTYAAKKLEFRTVRSIWPAALFARVDFSEKLLSLTVNADNFNPFQLFKMKQMPGFLKKFNGLRLTGSASVRYSFLNTNQKKSRLSYDATGSISLPDSWLDSPLCCSVSLSGSPEIVHIPYLSLNGQKLDAAFSGDYHIKERQPSGMFRLNKYVLSNGGIISTEVYIDPLDRGFMCFSPQLFLGDSVFTALQLTVLPVPGSIDFTFETDDYAHADYGKPGHIKIDGSILIGKNKFIQAGLVINDMFLDSMVRTAAFFMTGKYAEILKKNAAKFAPYICSDELYFSTDLKQFSFNAPYAVFANTKKERELFMFSADGSNQSIQLSRCDVLFGEQAVHGSAQVDFPANSPDIAFSGDFSVNSLPYRFNGNASPGWIGVTGDYGLDIGLSVGNDISGTIRCSAFPFTIGKSVITVTSEIALSWTTRDGVALNIVNFEAEEPTGNWQLRPKLSLTGTANRYGFAIDSIAYTDAVSVLNGSGSILWNSNEEQFDSAHAEITLSSPITSEKIRFSGDVTNPTHVPFSFDAIKNDIYFSSECSVVSFPMTRFLSDQSNDNTLSASCVINGTLSNPFVSMTVQNVSFGILGAPFVGQGSFVLDDSGFHVSDLTCSWMKNTISGLSAEFHRENFSAEATGMFDSIVAGQSIHAPFSFSVSSDAHNIKSFFSDPFTVVVDSKMVSGDFFDKPLPFVLTVNHLPGRFDIYSGVGLGISASILSNGMISIRTGSHVPFVFSIDGSITRKGIDLVVSGVDADLRRLSDLVDIPGISFSSGEFTGDCRITGLLTDPEFNGSFMIQNFNLDAPDFLQNSLKTDTITITLNQNIIAVSDTLFHTGDGVITFGMNLALDRWKLASINITLFTPGKNGIPIDLKVPFVHYRGAATMNLSICLKSDAMEFSGSTQLQNGVFEVITSSLQAGFASENIEASIPSTRVINSVEKISRSQSIKVQLGVVFGQHVQIQFNPLLRGVVVPDTPIALYYDDDTRSFSLKGDVTLRGGEIAWLNRNFYMKNGRIVFNETQNNMDPRLSVQAETRERDDEGNQVRVILSALNQPISTFNPRLSASPAKSELEIMELLGQIVTADSQNVSSLVMAGGDYLVQATVMRRIENALRELCNFDIFSVRTMVLQNALKQGLNLNSGKSQVTVGNFFDNSTVYIGKYFGSSLYLDALLHWTYDETKLSDSTSVGGLVFQPEFGLEMDSPYAAIRWGIAPDIEAMKNNMWVPATSITLSWKFSL